jgi:glycosyltransferase involved in cell wall biosynthesis
MMFEEGPLVSWAIRRADCVAYAARFLEEKINWMYRPRVPLTFLPNIERVPNVVPTKSERPTACFVGRFDRRKRPELYIELAKSVPDVQFLMVGRAEDANWQRTLEKMAKPVSNLTLLGYIDKFDDDHFYDVYDSSWVFINTASREAHPLTFFEAAGRGCAILSHVNPDDFASKFGFWAADEDFESGLRNLLDHGDWQKRGEIGYEYVKKNYNYEKAVRAHTDLYAGLLRS